MTNNNLDEKIIECHETIQSCELCDKRLQSLYIREIDRSISICIYQLAKAINMIEELNNKNT